MNLTLDKINLNQEVKIKKVNGNKEIRKRLFDLGFIPDMIVKPILVSPLKHMRAYQLGTSIYALREQDARIIVVEESE